MSDFRQPCPSCKSVMKLPESARGKLAKCPACEITFTAQGGGSTQAGGLEQAIEKDSPRLDPSASSGAKPLTITTAAIDQILPVATSVLYQRLSVCLLATLIFFVTLATTVVAPAILINEWIAPWTSTSLVAWSVLVVIGLLVVSYLLTGFFGVLLALVQRQENALRLMQPPLELVGRVLVINTVLGIVGGVGFCAVGSVLRATNPPVGPARTLLFFAAASVLLFQLFLTVWLAWSALPICVDGRANVAGSFRAAYALTSANKLTSFFIALMTVILLLVGTVTCFVGHLVTTPMILLIYVVGYRVLTGQHNEVPEWESEYVDSEA